MPASRAIASRCSTALVEPPLATTPAIAFSNDWRVRMSRGLTPRFNRSITSVPQFLATASLTSSTAGTLALPNGATPRNSHAIAIVLAVNWPPQAPAPGQA